MGSGNPPDKPGYEVVTIGSMSDDQATAELNNLSAQGFEVVAFDGGRVILANYKKDS